MLHNVVMVNDYSQDLPTIAVLTHRRTFVYRIRMVEKQKGGISYSYQAIFQEGILPDHQTHWDPDLRCSMWSDSGSV